MNKYSNLKLVKHRDKLNSILSGTVTAPVYVRIKPTNRCNHDCFFCVYKASYAFMHESMVKRDELSKEKLFEILDDFKNIGVKAVTYTGGGEPLIHPNIIEVMQKTLDNGIDLSIITNGQKLSGEKAEILSKSKWVRISMDYCDAEGFKTSQRGSERMFLEIIENIKNFVKREHTCDIEVNFIITKENHLKLKDSAKLLKDLGIDNIRYSPVWIKEIEGYHDKIKNVVIQSLQEIKEELNDEKFKIYSSYNEYSVSDKATHRLYTKCPYMQIVPAVGADQVVYNCHNQAYSEKGIIGSIKDRKFSEMWFSNETAGYFKSFNPQINCEGIQCAADTKNIFYNDLIDTSPDNFI
jgi:MoaA/NifB/PqqE/SkfB family radical SAM enzyme